MVPRFNHLQSHADLVRQIKIDAAADGTRGLGNLNEAIEAALDLIPDRESSLTP